MTETAAMIKEVFKDKIKDKFVVLHFDGKSVEEITDSRKLTNERIAVVITGPELEGEQVLGVVVAPSSKGSDQERAIIALLQEWEVTERIVALCCDTTASNTGQWRGACVLLQETLGRSLLNTLCNHHIPELHIKTVAAAVSQRGSKGPKELLFGRLQSNWNKILDTGINYDDLSVLTESQLSEDLLERAEEVKVFAEEVLSNETFQRGEYRQLVQLIYVYLGGHISSFKFATPGAYHRARFMSQALYYLKWALLMKQFGHLLSAEEALEVQEMAKFIALFYGQWWLESPMAASAPANCLKAFDQMFKYERENPVVAKACLDSLNRHTTYISPPLVVFALADQNLSYQERSEIAEKLVSFEKKDSFPPKKQKEPKVEKEMWNQEGKRPSLAAFVGPDSWLVFHLLQFKPDDLEWLQCDSSLWDLSVGYTRFEFFVKNLSIVNDCSERGVKLIEDLVGAAQQEGLRQDIMVSVADARKKMPKVTKANLIKRTINNNNEL